jgi:hypothetical protein
MLYYTAAEQQQLEQQQQQQQQQQQKEQPDVDKQLRRTSARLQGKKTPKGKGIGKKSKPTPLAGNLIKFCFPTCFNVCN